MAAAERLSQLAHVDRRHHRRRPLAGGPRHRRSRADGDRRLVVRTDLQQVREDARSYTNSRNVADYIGSGPHLLEGSPARNAAAIHAPVLLFHGDRDLNVGINHSMRMNDALRDAGRSSELVRFDGLEHDLADSAARVQMLERIGTFLGRQLNGVSRGTEQAAAGQ
jgi:fermentation-respiration switch protein FrsA (DUF1100 family)